nr:SGNH/GDSL hydrolase family protein [Lachnospiraceae bacterium]
MKDKITDKTKGLINRGNLSRVKKFLNRISDGEACVIAFIGGSITQGAVASTDELCYAKRVFDHISQLLSENQSHPESKLHPESHLTYINAGIGATTSQFGAARVYEDVLKYDPDLVFIEYSVNDNDEAPYERRELF